MVGHADDHHLSTPDGGDVCTRQRLAFGGILWSTAKIIKGLLLHCPCPGQTTSSVSPEGGGTSRGFNTSILNSDCDQVDSGPLEGEGSDPARRANLSGGNLPRWRSR
ncbi:hypothetical protein BO78DRAFT_174147 [Aspergillus sclerotiicarbonarius CBS 121057]|uniref:Uncharacterized protein n=1 Tax=Aspergillus sclerotiicarbonarius (strain CBS 121057 / IBT 28362) TaxID=1448318 RepID=A0A319ECM0_ASPSB|nr:hypothetical protein BO78DRAFT_174147 [Aspergillus sclerotiicarbonarius CBS 121057]